MCGRAGVGVIVAVFLGIAVSACSDQAVPAPSATASANPTAPVTSPAPPSPPAATASPPAATAQPSATAWAGTASVIRTVDTPGAVVLTFDAGSDAGHTALILDTLAGEGIRASFGVTGAWAEANPELVRRIIDEGHHLINHSYDHRSFTGLSEGRPPLSAEDRWAQLDDTEEAVLTISGATTKPYFRPPFGDYDDTVNADVGARGYRYNVMWTVDSYGWRGLPTPEIVSRCVDLAEPGAIYIFHVGSASQDGPALSGVIAGLRAAGYAFAFLPDVLD